VDVGVELRPLAEGLDHRHHPGAKALLLHGRRRHQLLDGLVGGQRERAEKLAMVQEVDPQHLGDREHPLGMAHLLHDLVLEEGGELGRPLGATGGTHSSTLAGEGDQVLLGTPPAANPCEAALPETAREIARHDLVHETPPEAVAALEALLPRALDPLVERLEKTVERCLPGIPGSVDPASDLHAQHEPGGRGTGGKRRRTSGPAFPTTARVCAAEQPGEVRERSERSPPGVP
jgi:hypothetical protein